MNPKHLLLLTLIFFVLTSSFITATPTISLVNVTFGESKYCTFQVDDKQVWVHENETKTKDTVRLFVKNISSVKLGNVTEDVCETVVLYDTTNNRISQTVQRFVKKIVIPQNVTLPVIPPRAEEEPPSLKDEDYLDIPGTTSESQNSAQPLSDVVPETSPPSFWDWLKDLFARLF